MYDMLRAIGIEEMGTNDYLLRLRIPDLTDTGEVLHNLVVNLGLSVRAGHVEEGIEVVTQGSWQQVVVVLVGISGDRSLFHKPANRVIAELGSS